MEDKETFDQGEMSASRSGEPAPAFMISTTAILTGIIRLAFEAAVLPNKFEIDEQTPLSRLDALIDQVSAELEQPAVVVSATDRAFILGLVDQVAERLRISIRQLSMDRHGHRA